MRYKIYSNITCPNRMCYGKYWKRSSLVFITKKCTQRKTLLILKTDVFELPDEKNIGKLF